MSVAVESTIPSPVLGAGGSETTSPLVELGRELTQSVPLSEPTEPEPESESNTVPEPQPPPNLWDEICKEFSAKRPPFREANEDEEASSQPATPTPPPRKSCSPREFLEYYIFPVLLPALEDMLRQAKLERCFERKRTKFNALDFLTEHLYRKNPFHSDRDGMELADIPFVQEHWKEHPRPPLPMSLLWNEEEAILIIQNFWRGYLVRQKPDVQELRQWQREWRQENEDISETVSDFWAKQMPDGDPISPCASQEQLDGPSIVKTPPVTPQQSPNSPASETNLQTQSPGEPPAMDTPPNTTKSPSPPASAPTQGQTEQ